MNLDQLLYRVDEALEHAKEVQRLVNLSQEQCRKVKDRNDWLDGSLSLLNGCDFDIDTIITDLTTILEGSVEEIKERIEK